MIVEPLYILRREDAKRCPILGLRNMQILILGSDLATSTCQGDTHGMDRETERATLYVEPVVINDRMPYEVFSYQYGSFTPHAMLA